MADPSNCPEGRWMVMKICFIASAESTHTVKWCRWFADRGHEVHVISFEKAAMDRMDGIEVHPIDVGADAHGNELQKIGYLFSGGKIKAIVKEIKPDIVHVHYASGYGIATALSGVSGYVLSVWGSDVYEFPRRSPLHRALLKLSLRKASYLFSTSQAMAEEASKYTDKPFQITPFGVDTALFSPDKGDRVCHEEEFIVGTVKTLLPKYGIDYLIKAVAMVHRNHPEIPIRLRIAGKGSFEKEYRELAIEEGIGEIVTWLGFIPQEEAAREWASMDVAVVYSTLESFGVSAVEAQSCGTPLIIADIPGLMEATEPGITCEVVPRKNVQLLSDAIVSLYEDKERRKRLGDAGREFVRKNLELDKCFLEVERTYQQILGGGADWLSYRFLVFAITFLEQYAICVCGFMHKEYRESVIVKMDGGSQ